MAGFSIQDYLKNNKIEIGNIKKEVGDTPYKGGHNDIRKTNYEVKIKEDGKLDLYTHKTIVTESTLNEDNWKLDKGEILFNNKRVGRYEFDRDADAFWIDNINSNGQQGFSTKEKAIQWLKKNKKAYLDRHNNSYHRAQQRYLDMHQWESVNEAEKLNEASEIEFDELTSNHQKQVIAFEKFFHGKRVRIWEGIHGIIAEIKVPTGRNRLDTSDLKTLSSMKLRWIEFDGQIVSIGIFDIR